MNTKNLLVLPDNLPVPEDDGACAHLEGMKIPAVALACTSGSEVHFGLERGTVVVYFFPMTGRPDALPMVGWNEIPGARGCCTRQANGRTKSRIICSRTLNLNAIQSGESSA